jgi:hypothetical protein
VLKEELEAVIKSDSTWAGRSTLILVIGILGEYVVLPFLENKEEIPQPHSNLWFTSRRPQLPPRRRGLLASPVLTRNLSLWKRPSKLAFACLVVAGIAGEYEFSSRIARNADKLQQISDRELADATNAAGAANDRATTASRENIKLGKDLEKERQKTARFQTGAVVAQRLLVADLTAEKKISADAHERREKEQQKTATAQKSAADAQRQLDQAIVTRVLGREPKENLDADLKKYAIAEAEIWYRDEDPEAFWFGARIRDSPRSAGWKVADIIPVRPARFNGSDLPLAGTSVVNNEAGAMFPFTGPIGDPGILASMLGAGTNSSADIRLAILAIAINANPLVKDTTLRPNFFRIVIAPRDPTSLR